MMHLIILLSPSDCYSSVFGPNIPLCTLFLTNPVPECSDVCDVMLCHSFSFTQAAAESSACMLAASWAEGLKAQLLRFRQYSAAFETSRIDKTSQTRKPETSDNANLET
jgi:hypothetical protein